jgi:ribosomal-protein-alanine N-acetyltransferase
MQVVLAPLTNADAQAVFALEQAAFSVPWTLPQVLSELTGALSVRTGGFDGEGLIGYCFARDLGEEAEILRIAVAPQRRGCGIGAVLLREALALLPNAKQVFLEVREGNAAARRLYEKLGFVQVGLRRGYYTMPAENGVIYRLAVEG